MTEQKKYYHSIDFQRGLVALFVCVYHFINHQDANGFLLEDGHALRTASSILPGSVFVFFLLSGYVITLSMQRQNFLLKRIGQFLFRRWIRIEIPYLISIFVYLSIAFLWAIKSDTAFQIELPRFLHHLTYTAGFAGYEWYNDVYWTLAVEFQFYILIALLFPLIMSNISWLKYGTLIALSTTAFFLTNNHLLFNYAPTFVIGILLYFYYTKEEHRLLNLLLIALCLVQTGFQLGISVSIYLLISALLISITVSKNNVFARLGKMAYSFYLLHGAFGGSLLYFFAKNIENNLAKYTLIIAGVIVSIGCSWIFHKLIEAPSQNLSKKVKVSNNPPKEEKISP